MIYESMKFVTDELIKYFASKLGTNSDPPIVRGNVSKLSGSDDSSPTNPLLNKVIISLVNIEEDRISRSPDNVYRLEDRYVVKNPKVHLNLYYLFTINQSDYDTSIKWMALVLQFFQHRNVFNTTNSPLLPEKIEKLIFDLFSLNFEQINHLWGTMGGKYYPSVLYKVRMVTVEDDVTDAEGDLIREVVIDDGLMK
jgi:Pvc16 N-terminal domain